VEFRETYGQALLLARQSGEPDPAKYVAQKYGYYNPLKSVFRTEPSQLEVTRILSTLNDNDRASVIGALRLFNAYGEQIGVKADTGRAQPSARAVSLQEARRRMAG
jgi:hypothetical protein